MSHRTACLLGVLLLLAAASAAWPADPTIAPGDTLKVDVLGEPGLSATHIVAADGTINVPLAGRVALAGLTASDATAQLAKALAGYMVDPQVSLALVERARLRIAVVGAVAKPGTMAVPPGTCVAEVIAVAGGTLPQADPARVRIVHLGGSETMANLLALARGDAEENRELAGGDQVIVPMLTSETGVRVVGQVEKPGLYPVGDEMTLWDAIAAAGGLAEGANPRDAVLTRAGGEQVSVDLTQLMTSEAIVSGMRLGPGDTLAVPGMAAQVYVLGAVPNPGPYAVPADATLLDVLAMAGGVRPTANLRNAYLLRSAPGTSEVERIPLRLDLLLVKGDATADLALQDGDKISIPEAAPRGRSFMDKAQPYLMPLIYLLGAL
jgi:protein involved in polysaccharide export with SLBB domain